MARIERGWEWVEGGIEGSKEHTIEVTKYNHQKEPIRCLVINGSNPVIKLLASTKLLVDVIMLITVINL